MSHLIIGLQIGQWPLAIANCAKSVLGFDICDLQWPLANLQS
jgi:hypothetical protein